MGVLTGPLAEPAVGGATDRRGRLIAPNAALLAVELSADANDPKLGERAARLAAMLNDYAGPAMPASQRRFLMHALREIAPVAARFDTLAAEDLAAEYLDSRRGLALPHGLSQVAGGLWHLADAEAGVTAVFREEALTAQMRSVADIAEPFAGATFSLSPPGGDREAFLSLPASDYLPGWKLEVRMLGADPFAAAAARQNAAYLWTGLLGIAVIAAGAAGVARYLSRQMKLARLKNDFVATVSHELKTPLASMRVLVDTQLEGRCTDRQQAGEYLHLIAKENERLSRLIDNFLTFSRMERNKRAFEFSPLDVGELAGEAVDSVAGKFDAPGVRLEVDVPENLPEITGDRDALVTVILNLLDNAHKYSGPDKRIALRARAGGGEVHLAVSDNGIGLSRRAARKVFDRFYQVDQSLSRAAGGCGLGLSIVKFIVDAHGGDIDVESAPGKGSTFTVRLPKASKV